MEINAAEVHFSEDEIKSILHIKIEHTELLSGLSRSVEKFRKFRNQLSHNLAYALRAKLEKFNGKCLLQYKMILGKIGEKPQDFNDNEISSLKKDLLTIFKEDEIDIDKISIKVTSEVIKSLMYSIIRRILERNNLKSSGMYVYYYPNEYSSSKIFKIYRGLEIRCHRIMNRWFILVKPKIVVDSCTLEELIKLVNVKLLINLYCKALRFEAPEGEVFKQGIIKEVDTNNLHATVEFYDGVILKVPLSNIKLLGRFEYYKHILSALNESYEELQQRKRELAYNIGYKEFKELKNKGKYTRSTLAEEYYYDSLSLLKMITSLINNTYLNNVKIHIEPFFMKVGQE